VSGKPSSVEGKFAYLLDSAGGFKGARYQRCWLLSFAGEYDAQLAYKIETGFFVCLRSEAGKGNGINGT
jgi:hypothetical protein